MGYIKRMRTGVVNTSSSDIPVTEFLIIFAHLNCTFLRTLNSIIFDKRLLYIGYIKLDDAAHHTSSGRRYHIFALMLSQDASSGAVYCSLIGEY